MKQIVILLLSALVFAMPALAGTTPAGTTPAGHTGVLTAGFICTPGVFNTELMAPWDVIQHSIYRDGDNYVRTVLVTQDGEAFRTAEGLTIGADYSFANAPDLDIVLVPSSEGSMGVDLENAGFIDWLRDRCEKASWVITLCDGAFPVAETGLLDGRVATTYPGDRDAFAARFPKIDVRYDVRFVVDGKFITSTGGAPSYEPAFWLMEHLYGAKHVEDTGRGLVFPWDAAEVPHLVVN